MTALDDTVKVTELIADGDHFQAGQVLARVEGSARASCRPSGSRSTWCSGCAA